MPPVAHMEVVLEPHQHASVMKTATNVLIVVMTYKAYAMKVTRSMTVYNIF